MTLACGSSDLHDGAQQRLVALALSLRLVARSAEPATAAALRGCIEDLHAALGELRELARGLHPAVLTQRGLPAALQEPRTAAGCAASAIESRRSAAG